MCVLFSTQTYPIFVTGTTGSSCKEQFFHVEKLWHVEKFEFYNMEKICHVGGAKGGADQPPGVVLFALHCQTLV